MTTRPFCVKWRGEDTLLGRPLFEYELESKTLMYMEANILEGVHSRTCEKEHHRLVLRSARLAALVILSAGQFRAQQPIAATLDVRGISGPLGIKFIQIPAGDFTMGCSPGDEHCVYDEKPPHKIKITKPFQMGKYEVTQAQWQTLMGSNPSYDKGNNHPVERVSWQDVQRFLGKLNTRNDGYRYRLPTEAEWEYSARAGSTGPYYGNVSDIAWFCSPFRDSLGFSQRHHPVGQKSTNTWGLHDMLGNVWEWVQDWYDDRYYSKSRALDPVGAPSGLWKVIRGGSAEDDARIARVSRRLAYSIDDRHRSIGFRCVRIELGP